MSYTTVNSTMDRNVGNENEKFNEELNDFTDEFTTKSNEVKLAASVANTDAYLKENGKVTGMQYIHR